MPGSWVLLSNRITSTPPWTCACPGGFRGGLYPRRRKPFIGGSLESQREWERDNLCCFHIQGSCKFGDRCRYSHDDDGTKRCQFGLSCRVGHQTREGEEGEEGGAAPAHAEEGGAPAAAADGQEAAPQAEEGGGAAPAEAEPVANGE